MAAIERGVVTVTTKARLLELESRRDRCETALARAAERPPRPALHPNLAKIYRRRVANLEAALNDPACRDEAAMALRELIDAVVTTLAPGEARSGPSSMASWRPCRSWARPKKQRPAHLAMYGSRWLRG
jgi:site-specific DNA recombinase